MAKVTKKAKKNVFELAPFGDPLVTKNGDIIDPEPLPSYIKPPKTENRQLATSETFRAVTKRTIESLSAQPTTVHACAAVLMYTILGVGDREICTALKMDNDQLKAVRAHAMYDECFGAIQSEFINANSAMLHARIAAYSHKALDTVAHLSENAKKEETKLTAARDILDRAGTKAPDAGAKTSNNQGLKITIIDRSSEVAVEVEGIG